MSQLISSPFIGTETDGSIVAPSAANSVVGLKPSRGMVPGEGIVPLIKEIDTPGPIGKTVRDVTVAYNALTGKQTSLDTDGKALSGKNIGLAGYDYVDEEVLLKIKKELQGMNAKIIDINLNEEKISIFNEIKLSFKKDFEDYAAAYGLPIKKLDDLIKFNKEDAKRRIKYGQDLLEEANNVEKADKRPIEASIRNARLVLDSLFADRHLDAIVFLNSSGTTAPAAAGYPELAVPFGKDSKGVPQSATFMTKYGEDEKLLNMGYSFEKRTQGRMVP
ncbi:amidase family protein [Bacillus sp. 1P06AnD]|uniref:amidase family protein n=1 Tax=Bacillus sp. 1P06AnD TaxID=3132208 RepID=UPI0039A051D5